MRPSGKKLGGFPVGHSFHFVHHLLEVDQVASLDRNDGNIAHCAELSAVVQVLVLQPKEIPYETPKNKHTLKVHMYFD